MYFLARYLLAAARRTIVPEAEGHLSGSERLVLEDLVEAAPTTINEISQRTQIAQSRVSAIIAEWRKRGAIDTSSDPNDRRKTVVAPSKTLQAQYLAGALASAEDVLDQLGVELDAKERKAVLGALSLLHGRLRPEHADDKKPKKKR